MSEIPDGEPQIFGRDFGWGKDLEGASYTWGGNQPADPDSYGGYMEHFAHLLAEKSPIKPRPTTRRDRMKWRIQDLKWETTRRLSQAVSALKGEL